MLVDEEIRAAALQAAATLWSVYVPTEASVVEDIDDLVAKVTQSADRLVLYIKGSKGPGR